MGLLMIFYSSRIFFYILLYHTESKIYRISVFLYKLIMNFHLKELLKLLKFFFRKLYISYQENKTCKHYFGAIH